MGIIINNKDDLTPESAGAYIKQGLESDFIELAKKSKDKNFIAALSCMLHLASHLITRNQTEKINPKKAFDNACEHYPSCNEIMVKTLVTQFSIRGEEFGDWVENPEKWETLWEIEK